MKRGSAARIAIAALIVSLALPTPPVGAATPDSASVQASSDRRAAAAVTLSVRLIDSPAAMGALAGPESAVAALENGDVRPLSLASADFNEDGVPDLVVGYAASTGGILTLQRGNLDAIFPNSAEARQRAAQGKDASSAFLPGTTVFALPQAPAYLAAGDFDADGHWDVAIAAAGTESLWCLAGDGRGSFAQPMRFGLPGTIGAMLAGEVNRRDGLTDLVISVEAADGASLLVFEGPGGALMAAPEVIPLPVAAHALAIGQLDGDSLGDVAIAAGGGDLTLLHGRDRELTHDSERRAAVAPPVLDSTRLGYTVVALAVGDFRGTNRDCLALLDGEGGVHYLDLYQGVAAGGAGDPVTHTVTAAIGKTTARLVTTHLSADGADGVLLVGGTEGGLTLVPGAAVTSAEVVRLATEARAVAALPMRLNADTFSDLVVLEDAPGAYVTARVTAMAASYVITSGDPHRDADNDMTQYDSADGHCADDYGECTLVAAVFECENSSAATCEYTFSIPGSGVPAVYTPRGTGGNNYSHVEQKPHVIDGTTQPGGWVRLIGEWGTSNSTFRGIVSAYTLACGWNCIIEGNRLGMDDDGTGGDVQSNVGIYAGSNCTIGGTTAAARNVVGGFATAIQLYGSRNVVQGNYVGTDATGTTSVSSSTGIYLYNGQPGDAHDNTIGGTVTGAGNVISGNAVGISTSGTTDGDLIQGNLIGSDPTGAAFVGGSRNGIYLTTNGTTIGGTSDSMRNVIVGSGESSAGIEVVGTDVVIQGNYIGTNAAGTATLGSLYRGIHVSWTSEISIGGTAVGAGNVICGADSPGIYIRDHKGENSDLRVQGNWIGTDRGATLEMGNGYGVYVRDSSNVLIGGSDAGAANVIAHNEGWGVFVEGSTATGNAILGNSIYDNGYYGIDLDPMGVTPNDPHDADTGANGLQNAPVLDGVETATGLELRGALHSTPSHTFRVEYFANCAPNDRGRYEGQVYLGSSNVSTGQDGDATLYFASSYTGACHFATATATDITPSGQVGSAPLNNTSEFSAAIEFEGWSWQFAPVVLGGYRG